jgi:hypothetical protein
MSGIRIPGITLQKYRRDQPARKNDLTGFLLGRNTHTLNGDINQSGIIISDRSFSAVHVQHLKGQFNLKITIYLRRFIFIQFVSAVFQEMIWCHS